MAPRYCEVALPVPLRSTFTYAVPASLAGEPLVGRRVVVIGAGNTAIDAARAARRLGAESVQILYRRDHQRMAAFAFEYTQALSEGVAFRWWTQPVAIHTYGPTISAIECVSTDPATLAGSALSKAEVQVGGSKSSDTVPAGNLPSFRIPCDTVIPAIGQSPLLSFLELCRGVKLENNRVVVDRNTGQTSDPQYFAGGDCVNGGREVVDAVADGKRSAQALGRILEGAHA